MSVAPCVCQNSQNSKQYFASMISSLLYISLSHRTWLKFPFKVVIATFGNLYFYSKAICFILFFYIQAIPLFHESVIHFIVQVTTLVNHKRKSKTGKSKKANQLVTEIDEAITRFVSVGESIAIDYPEIREPMVNACKETRTTGKLPRI